MAAKRKISGFRANTLSQFLAFLTLQKPIAPERWKLKSWIGRMMSPMPSMTLRIFSGLAASHWTGSRRTATNDADFWSITSHESRASANHLPHFRMRSKANAKRFFTNRLHSSLPMVAVTVAALFSIDSHLTSFIVTFLVSIWETMRISQDGSSRSNQSSGLKQTCPRAFSGTTSLNIRVLSHSASDTLPWLLNSSKPFSKQVLGSTRHHTSSLTPSEHGLRMMAGNRPSTG